MTHVGSISKNNCTGCKMCADICPVDAIHFETNTEGFWYPAVNDDSCIKCSLCVKSCPNLTLPMPNQGVLSAYAAYNNDMQQRISSTSGGIFSVLAQKTLENNGVVIGARYVENFLVAHYSIEKAEDIPLLRQSKYLQSDTQSIYKEVHDYLREGRNVLFCGTPCHNAALRSFVGNCENLVQCDFICRGIISPKVFSKYLSELEKKAGSKASAVQFKNKDQGWHHFGTKITFENGKEYYKDRKKDKYMAAYLLYNLTMRPSCHSCAFKGTSRYGDITLADFWGIEEVHPEMDQDVGTSAILINSKKGDRLIKECGNEFKTIEVTVDQIATGNTSMCNTTPEGKKRKNFFRDIDRYSFSQLFKKYAKTSVSKTLMKSICRLSARIQKMRFSKSNR